MKRALAVRGEDDRPVAGFLDELVEGRRDVAVGKLERLLRILALEQERAVGRLAIARRPDLPRAVKRARLALHEEVGPELGIAARVERRVPAVGLEVRRRVNVEDGCFAPRSGSREAVWK